MAMCGEKKLQKRKKVLNDLSKVQKLWLFFVGIKKRGDYHAMSHFLFFSFCVCNHPKYVKMR